LQGRLEQLERTQAWLTDAQGALATTVPGTPPPAADSAEAAPAPAAAPQAVPRPRRAKNSAGKTGKSRTTARSTSVPDAQKPDAAAAKTGDGPPLRDLVLSLLLQRHEPLQASEVASELAQLHPERSANIPVVRNTLETLVARNEAERSKQKRSVFYGAVTKSGTASIAPEVPAEPQDTVETSEEKVTAEV
jgi:hypothetical protein